MSENRRQSILDIARQVGLVTVDELLTRFNVTPQTIRKDLNRLCDERLLTRTHGGARLASSVENMSYEARRMLASDQKQAIGRAVAAIIPDNASLFVNIGTTTEAVAQALLQHRHLLVITNNINVASAMRPYSDNKVIIASGEVRSSDGGVIGESAVDFIKQFKVDFAVIGASAIDSDGALLDYDYREVKVSQAILSNARHVILVADSTKHERSAPIRIGHISQAHSFVTDHCPDAAFRALLSSFDVRTIETDLEPTSGSHTPGGRRGTSGFD
ncbi:Glycerol-3-phosphate regulon repressor [Granulosicoccus antarcticus IMCC3135]|uniref:Glycerol-3-phosphate regulon repressor n=1 Tax=Granulosicoccus antarcticus IMCC3135 TaxID=1192854 RepID=A0A2Z2NHF0_9GAMM|nr:DeoR/GlpR family DNA-binding transcription regulator [Granulosicoccus antarcticus]ASJ70569.1 Glycerol-3-phosphate regulon repressor [Granulosicoccus antarcticus IMCC3135]